MGTVAYLVSQYPATSHTFIRREVAALRRRGIDILTYSVRRPGAADRLGAHAAEYESTFYLLPPEARVLCRAHLKAVFRRPRRYLGTLRAALQHRVPGARALFFSLFHFGEAIVLADELEQRGVTHLHNHFANSAATVGYLASRHTGIGWSLTLHGTADTDYPAGVLLAAKIAHARFVSCVSYFGKSEAQRRIMPELWDKLFVTRCGLNLSELAACQTAARDRVRILHVGRLSAEKGQLGLLSAFAQLLEQGGDAELDIIGDGPERARLERRIAELGLSRRCRLLGSVSEREVLEELSRSDIFVLSSFMEGLPVVLMEAMAMKLPVVAPRVAGIPELVEHGRNGLLFNPARWDELCERLSSLVSDAALRQRLAENGRQRVLAEFDIDTCVEPLAAHLLQVVG
jgi:glycosyltransferase involved in cell wall biosynthesis